MNFANPQRRVSAWVIAVLCPLALLAMEASPAAAGGKPDPASYVNPFNGTEPGAKDFGTGGGAANTFPGAVMPFGMVDFSPDTYPGWRAFGGGYTYSDDQISGFSMKHMSGPGCGAYQDFPILPTTVPIKASPAKPDASGLADDFNAGFSHKGEAASPGFYSVKLDPGTGQAIGAQLSATTRTGIARFTFPASRTSSVILNSAGSTMGARQASVAVNPARHEISGSVESGQFCYGGNRYRMHFVAQFSRPFAAYGTWDRGVLGAGSRSASDSIPDDPLVTQPLAGLPEAVKGLGTTAQAGGYATFDTRKKRSVEVRVGLSFVSVKNARMNLRSESAKASFESVKRRGRAAWNRMLGRASVTGGRVADRKVFYTQLYHSLIHPSTFSDVDGQYMGFDEKVHTAHGRRQYADISGWDTYRTQMPLVAMLAPNVASDIAASLLADSKQSGALPKWSQANGHTHVMVGDSADPLIAGAYAFGARSFDSKGALKAMVEGATRYGLARTKPDYYERAGLPEYLRLGYVPHELNTDSITTTFRPDLAWGTASTTLEYAFDDFSIAQLAGARCDRPTYSEFMKRSANWRNVFDPSTKYATPRYEDGSFKATDPDDEEGFVEGNSAQYTLFVPHDPAGLIEALGGPGAALERFDDFFSVLNAGPSSPHAFLGNEPTLGTPWLYYWVGKPSRTQDIVRRAMFDLYDISPGGMPGNDDLGSMSSWWVYAALGLYPVSPGSDVLALGTPLFPQVKLNLGGKTVTLRVPQARRDRPYLVGAKLRGSTLKRAWLHYSELARGGTLDLAASGRPSRTLGADPVSYPPSYGPNQKLTGCPER